MVDDFDIIIIGAGIAGTTCAILCARAGMSALLLERGEQPGQKNLSGGRLYGYVLNDIIAGFPDLAPLERAITHEHFSLLTDRGATTLNHQQPASPSWSILRARFDPWYAEQAQAAGAQCLFSVTVDALHRENDRVAGVLCGGDLLRAGVVVLAEGANSLLAEQCGLIPAPSPTSMALGIKETLALEPARIEERFHLETHQGAAWLFSGNLCGNKQAGAFLYTNRQSLSLGVVAPLASLRDGPTAASALLSQLKKPPTLRPLLRGTQTLEYGAHLVPEGGLHSLPRQRAGNGWLLAGDTLRTCVNAGFTVRGMDMAMLSARAAADTLIAARRRPEIPLHALYDRQLQRSLLWQQLKRYQHLPTLLQRSSWYQSWPALCHEAMADLSRVDAEVNPALWRILLRHGRRMGLRRLTADVIRSLQCL
ncbi:FAD-dependent oxidoreductase [[Enterobacter] lignolyticus]|uniref:Protein FixC n=1 Tax=[Enterobacter] lignolyticus TaxID=1334193 RepID=A0A806XAA2_9ENTR|nr:FAD-dependent oxidoreductase [[Enterobacter] lignolyticus]ALR77882.1 FAD-dependent oxidoreductase [[Enterobacter] lignolyticus]